MKRILFALAILVAGCAPTGTKQPDEREMDAFIDDLMGRMTLEEKIGQ